MKDFSTAPGETVSSGAFVCKRCGNCCRREGEVVITPLEADAIAAYLGVDFDVFMRDFTALSADRRDLVIAGKADRPCRFFEETAEGPQCKIQCVKPRQCRDFPLRWNYPGWENDCAGGKNDSQR